LTLSYNNVWNNTTNYYGTSAGANDISLYPKFIDPAPGVDNFNLKYNSHCIDAGNPAYNDPDGSRADIGKNYFDLTLTGTMAVYAKNPSISREGVSALTTYEVTWYATKEGVPYDHIALQYTTDGGLNYNNIVSSTPNTGSYGWTLPNISAEVGVRVQAVTVTTFDSVTDESSGTLLITPMRVTVKTPNGGENYFAGADKAITWETTSSPEAVNIYYTTGEGYISIADGIPNTGSYIWTPPAAITTEAKIKIEAIKTGGYIATDESDSTFIIANPVVYVNAVTGLDSRNAIQANNPASPWKTISKATTTVSSGCTINVLAGTYDTTLGETFPLIVPASVEVKSLASPTTAATVDATGGAGSYIFQLSTNSTIDGFTATATDSRHGVYVAGNGSNILNNTIRLTQSGYYGVYLDTNIISTRIINNQIYSNSYGTFTNGGNDNTTFQNNRISA
jgi:hypothetical protein